MTFEEFIDTTKRHAPPEHVSPLLASLWHDRKGNWNMAHTIAQEVSGAHGARVHAYLHRKEGDIPNAEYWYSRARISNPDTPLDAEWETLVREFLRKD